MSVGKCTLAWVAWPTYTATSSPSTSKRPSLVRGAVKSSLGLTPPNATRKPANLEPPTPCNPSQIPGGVSSLWPGLQRPKLHNITQTTHQVRSPGHEGGIL